MSDIFYDVASIDYPILDADAHVNEPPDLWQSRVPQRLRARAPKVLRTETGDLWSFDDGKRLRPLGLTATVAPRSTTCGTPSSRTVQSRSACAAEQKNSFSSIPASSRSRR